MGGRTTLTEEEAWAVLERATVAHVGAVVDGAPLLRTLHPIVHRRQVLFHGSDKGEKAALAGAEVVVQCEEVVASIPSWMRDPDRACPATTFYRSVQLRGRLLELDDPVEKADALQAMMRHYQPEGGHVPIAAEHPLYRKAVRTIRVLALRPAAISGVAKLGQDKTAGHVAGILRGLWRRGAPGDMAAIEEIRAAHPGRPDPFDSALHVRVHPSEADLRAAVELVRDAYWNTTVSREALLEAHRASTAWVGLEDDGRLVATARAISDRAKRSWIYDVAVAPDRRGEGIGAELMRRILDHPAVRATEVNLATRDAAGFYERFGFSARFTLPGPPWPRTTMSRAAPAGIADPHGRLVHHADLAPRLGEPLPGRR